VYRFKAGENRVEFDKIVAVTFPQLLNIGTRIVNETSLEAGEMLRTVLKAYKHAIYVSGVRMAMYKQSTDGFRSLTFRTTCENSK